MLQQWRTWLLVPTVYAAWLLAVLAYDALGQVAGSILIILATCWFTSLQHELIHGHPSKSRRVNRLMGLAPFAVWYPYELYLRSHLAHHRDELLTEPGIDPESNYIDDAAWRRLNCVLKPMWIAQRLACSGASSISTTTITRCIMKGRTCPGISCGASTSSTVPRCRGAVHRWFPDRVCGRLAGHRRRSSVRE